MRKYITKKVKDYLSEDPDIIFKYRDVKLSVTVEIYENWHTKKGAVKKKDIANREKFLIDSVFNALGLDDCFIFEHTMFKVQSEEEKVAITVIRLEK